MNNETGEKLEQQAHNVSITKSISIGEWFECAAQSRVSSIPCILDWADVMAMSCNVPRQSSSLSRGGKGRISRSEKKTNQI